jgi:hypothetical protein
MMRRHMCCGLLVVILFLGLAQPALAQSPESGSGVLVAINDTCAGINVRYKVDNNVPFVLRLFDPGNNIIFGEATGRGSGDRFVERSLFVTYRGAPAPAIIMRVEMYINNDFASPISVLELALTCSTPGVSVEEGRRVVNNSNFVVFLKNDGSLEYYEVVNSQGFFIGRTPPGWRNDNLGRQLIQAVSNPQGARAELWHFAADQYFVDFYRSGSATFLGSGTFSAAGVATGTGVVTAAPVVTPAPVTQPPAAPVVRGPVRDNGVSLRATGSYDGTFYTVAAGDNLYRIALRFNTTLGVLQAANGISNPSRIHAGQRLRIQ